MKLQGKNVLITGAAKRIGHEIALTLAASGACILIHYRRSRPEAEILQKEIVRKGGKALLFQADFSKISGIKKFTDEVYRKAGRIDVLVNNASIFYPTPLGSLTEKDWDDFLAVNLKAPFFLSQAAGEKMLKRKSGKIINLLDWTAERPGGEYLPYCISKAGLLAATRGMAKAFAPHVQVLGVAPGPILPPEGVTGRKAKARAEKTLLKRYGSPEDVAETVRFLIEGTDFMTGAVVPVEGGASIA